MKHEHNLVKEQQLQKLLANLPITLTWYKRISSTNTSAKQIADRISDPGFMLIGSDEQTAGYGKKDRKFISSAGGVYLSLICPIDNLSRHNQGLLTTGIAWCLHEAILELFHLDTEIKWVNDLLFKQKKIAGILVEQVKPQLAVIGIGCNLHQATPDLELANAANLLVNPPTDALFCQFVNNLIQKIVQILPNFAEGKFLTDYKKRLTMLGHDITVQIGHKKLTGRAIDLDQNANLILQIGATHYTLNSGEVTKVRPN
ncbi:biotin--[acetyl-CoA-carboxylase] ligase [Lactobacillus sp. ESL0684]|uniref:biotin--[acetyl-CoA-carboxylase] ligase n=1 Tax=unclassified Lactobacillus TaxID=2620435 RepID=UPI0023F8ED18|nr:MULTISPECIES: biotin--[acetyl-CoA-carboxylase] ligase [unclassified Lactobacillus]WEV40491.1 biotin--[acetyl-CoA-carboxylase] ligase [Lactobacillus sp. ESL0681]WEV43056.1 biotin--[acetyl-CoA-carboxylase] ligase [Lactobacillus sp. ESL0684]